MNRIYFCYILSFLKLLISIDLCASDTLYIKKQSDIIEVQNHISIFEDPTRAMPIGEVSRISDDYSFYNNTDPKLNFEYTRSNIWLRLIIKSVSIRSLNYIMEISNPDLDHISFFELKNDSVTRSIHTGELMDVSSRDMYHRNFIFNLSIEPGEILTYYILINNNGHPYSVPIELLDVNNFKNNDKKADLLNWLVYGLLIFIVIFNGYLFWATKDEVNIYYALSLLFAIIFMIHYDGYFYLINPPVIFEKIKWINPCLYSVFLLLFTQSFVSNYNRLTFIDKYIKPLIFFVLIAPFARNLNYPYSLITDVGVPILVLIAFIFIITMAVASLRNNYLPSLLFMLAYVFVFLGLFIHQLKEFDLINPYFIINNSIKLGLTGQNILLTLAVLERFRISQNNDKKIINDNLSKIEFQNKELEIINTELEKLSIVASETDNSIAIYDENGRLEWGNSGFEKLYESNTSELIKDFRDKIELIIPNLHISKYANTCRETQQPVVFETPVLTKSGNIRWIQTTLSPFIRSGKIFKIIAIDSDITSLKIYEKELETAKEKAVESDRLKTAFLSNMSHEIRTPLNGIMGFSQLLNRNELSNEEMESYLEIIKTCGEQLLHIIDDILEISLIESNQLKVFPVEFELKTFIREITGFFETYKTTIGKGDIKLISDLEIREDHFNIVSDPFRLKQVLTNLLKNAFKFTKEGQIKIGIYPESDYLYFYVQDTGISIDPEKKNIIFERFRQGEETLSRKYGGSGLGLSISKGIIEKLGGKIWLDTSYNNGFKIYFTIPLVKSGGAAVSVQENRPGNNHIDEKIRNKKVLIVEDHDISYKFLQELLSPFKPEISWAVSGKEAVDLIRNNNFDIVLMDVNLPEMDGISATREIRKIRPELPILMQTAHAMESELSRIRTSGCDDVISKPINVKELIEKLVKYL